MNKSLRWVAVVVAVMFFALMANITGSYFFRSEELLNDPRNSRVRDDQFGGPRGDILAANTPIAGVQATGQRPFLNARVYPQGQLYAPVTGYYSYTYGASGLEAKYNAALVGQADSQFVGRIIDTLTGRQPAGGNLQTSINPGAQQAAWDALGGREGAVVAIDYTTGAILTWVSTPSYDPGTLASTDIASTVTAWDGLQADPGQPMLDRATREVYPPGSTFKLVTAAAALEAGYKPDTMIDTPAQLQLPQSTSVLPNESDCGNTQVTFDKALTLSCNTSFANIGMKVGDDALRKKAEAFGFDSSFGGDVNSATSRFPDDPSQAELAMSSIGQFEVAATPLQMAVVAGAIANDGVAMKPYVVDQVRDSNQRVISTTRPSQASTAMKKDDAQTLATMMTHVVESGTGTAAKIPGEVVGGKTGTAENASGAQAYSWFTGYMESSHVAVAVFLAEPGQSTATPVARQVLEALR